MSSLQVRKIQSDDHFQWLPLWEGYNRFYGRFGRTALPQEITQRTWQRFLDEKEPMYALVAERNGKLLGLAHFLFHLNTTMIHPICYLQDVYTREDSRGQGIGKALILAVFDEAKARHSRRVYWQTHESNTVAMKLYDKMAERSGFLIYRKDLEALY